MPVTDTRVDAALIASGKSLFSRHYLENHLPRHPEWAEDGQAVYTRLTELWERAQRLGRNWNENQTETEFLRPALEALGWCYIPQVRSTSRRLQRPDYALFLDEAEKEAAYPLQQTEAAFYARVSVIAEAKHWERPLSQRGSDDRESWDAQTNPSHQMVSYLFGTGRPWGILTNGRVWRLYSREVSSTASEYYETDLAAIFTAPEAERADLFKLWWLFFRRAAFIQDVESRNFVQRVAVGSATYARQVSETLKDLVYREVMPELAAGFIAYRRTELGVAAETESTLAEIYRASLSFLYKLLFILYAEARGLLPVDKTAYRDESLTRMAQGFAEKFDRGQQLSNETHATGQYDNLRALFNRIDRGDRTLGVPRYDGGLFNPATPENRFLETHRLSDQAVARVVDLLVRDAGQPVDYGYISVRNLGSIYEGLLENRLQVEPGPGDAGAPARVTLINDRGERRATGSYYTPDYIVEYIVRQTLGPVLAERAGQFERAMARVGEARRKLAAAADTATIHLLRAELESAELTAREAFLGIKVCDPAMGSGHFLVNAVDFLTDGIIGQMQKYHDEHPKMLWEWNPIQQLVERVRKEITDEMARQSITIDPARLDDTRLLTRLVMKRCVYGVDLNRMAVELAKLSLWLHSFTVGAPLSFLDHHLRWGNSLIGTDVCTVEAAMRGQAQTRRVSRESQQLARGRGEAVREAASEYQFDLFAGPFAGLLDLTAVMLQVAGRSDTTLADVRQSADEFDALQQQLTPYKQALDIWVSRHFGNSFAEALLTLHGPQLLPGLKGEREPEPDARRVVEAARKLFEEKRFFHWDLEFPEVFVDLARRDWAENPGFDAVIGNPPYDELSEDARGQRIDEMDYLHQSLEYAPALGYRVNLYRLFIAKALFVTRRTGWHSFIVPLSLLADQFTRALREFLLANVRLHFVEQFPQKDNPRHRVFADAKLSTCVYVTEKAPPTDGPTSVRTHPGREILDSSPKYSTVQSSFAVLDPLNLSIPGLGQEQWTLILRLASDPRFTRLETIASALPGELMINRQFQPYLTNPGNGEEIIRGSHIGMYALVEPKQGAALYLNRLKYLSEHSDSAKAQHHQAKRVVYQRYAAIDNYRRLIATILPEGYFCSHTVGYLSDVHSDLKLGFLVSLLNSILLDWRFNFTSTNNNVNGYEVEALPIPIVASNTAPDERGGYSEVARRFYDEFNITDNPSPLLAFVDAHLAASRTDVIHDLLAHLAEQMMALNKAKQAEVTAFLGWLIREIGVGLDSLTNKTLLENYLGDYQKGAAHAPLEQVLGVLKKNQRKLAADPTARAFQERLKAEYEASLAKLLPLKRQLSGTDRLIDQIVYKLYGLTDAEIAVVEGQVRRG